MILRTYKNLLKEYESGLFGYATIGIIGQSCVGSIAVMYILMNDYLPRPLQMFELFLVTIFCMGFNAAVLSQQTGKTQFNVLIISVLASVILIAINLI